MNTSARHQRGVPVSSLYTYYTHIGEFCPQPSSEQNQRRCNALLFSTCFPFAPPHLLLLLLLYRLASSLSVRRFILCACLCARALTTVRWQASAVATVLYNDTHTRTHIRRKVALLCYTHTNAQDGAHNLTWHVGIGVQWKRLNYCHQHHAPIQTRWHNVGSHQYQEREQDGYTLLFWERMKKIYKLCDVLKS